MIPVETVSGMGGGEDKGEWWRVWIKYDTCIHCKNFYKCHNVPPTQYNKKKINQLSVVVHGYNPSYLGGRGRRILSSRPAWAKLVVHFLKSKIQNKRAGDIGQVVEHLPSKG
jgi:hypothetical protein